MTETVERATTLESSELRALTVDEFHPAVVRRVMGVGDTIFDETDPATPAETVASTEAVCVVVEHPNGEQELVYEYTETLVRHANGDFARIEEGDTVWIADWEDVHRPVITPGDRDYAICTDIDEAATVEPQRARDGVAVLAGTIAATVTVIVGAVAALAALVTDGIGLTVGWSAVSVACLWAAWNTDRLVLDWFDSPHEITQGALRTNVAAAPRETGDADVLPRIARFADLFDSWEPVTVVGADVDSGELRCRHLGLEREVCVQFDTPRKWSDDYDIVRLAKAVGVGSVEMLEGESLHIAYDHGGFEDGRVIGDIFTVRLPN